MKTVRYSIQDVFDRHYGNRYVPDPNGGFTDLQNGDCVLKVRKANENAGAFGKLIIDNPAKVSRSYDSFTVHQPGFYIYRHIRKRIKTISVILFTNVGRFNSYDIYDYARTYGRSFTNHGIFGEDPLFQGDDFEKSSFKSCIPYGGNSYEAGIRNPAKLLELDFGKKLHRELLANLGVLEKEPEDQEPVEIEEVKISEDCMFAGCRAILSTKKVTLTVKPNGAVEEFSFPGIKIAKDRIYNRLNSYNLNRGPRRHCPHWYNSHNEMVLYFFDDRTKEIVWDDEVHDQFAAFYSDKKEVITLGVTEYSQALDDKDLLKGVKMMLNLMGPSDFKERINALFKEKGMVNHEVVDVWPSSCQGGWTCHNFETGRSEFRRTNDEGYYIVVNYKGREIIGPNSNTSFRFLCVKDEGDRIRLIHSSKCQHVTAWSGNITDQQYDHWNVTDWITGPMAESAGIKMEEFPVVFMGNKLTKTRKQTALDQLRARLNRIG